MKISNLFIAALLAFSPLFLIGQNTSGEVIFTETIKLHIDLPDGDEAMKKMLPSEQKITKSLVFNEKASLYKNAGPTGEGDIDLKHEEDGNDINIKMKVPEVVQFTDLQSGGWVRAEEFFGRDFLVTGEPKKLAWKLTGEQKKLGDYICQKAILQDTAQVVTAWFTPQIPVSAGPGQFGQLPGLILELEMDGGDRNVKATKIDLKPIEKSALAKPKKGKAVTADEFDKIREEKMKEMGAETGGKPGQMRMIIRDERH